MRVLITGRGSIAHRHVRLLRELRPDAVVGVLTAGEPGPGLRPSDWLRDWDSVLAWKPQAVVVASVSVKHADEVSISLCHDWPCLAEKPLVVSREQLEQVRASSRSSGASGQSVVGCNLRYLPSLHRVADVLHRGILGRVVRAHFEVGQNLAQWRPGRDLMATYSARADQGGGVVFDLVHEIDVACWLLGSLGVKAVVAGRFSGLGIQSDDVHVALLRRSTGEPVTVSLDYVSQRFVRRYIFVGEFGTLYWDLPAKKAWIDVVQGQTLVTDDPTEFDVTQTYRAQMQDWLKAIDDPHHRVRSPLDDALTTTALMLTMCESSA